MKEVNVSRNWPKKVMSKNRSDRNSRGCGCAVFLIVIIVVLLSMLWGCNHAYHKNVLDKYPKYTPKTEANVFIYRYNKIAEKKIQKSDYTYSDSASGYGFVNIELPHSTVTISSNEEGIPVCECNSRNSSLDNYLKELVWVYDSFYGNNGGQEAVEELKKANFEEKIYEIDKGEIYYLYYDNEQYHNVCMKGDMNY